VVGFFDGMMAVGFLVGALVEVVMTGLFVGDLVGFFVGVFVGFLLGFFVGGRKFVGAAVTELFPVIVTIDMNETDARIRRRSTRTSSIFRFHFGARTLAAVEELFGVDAASPASVLRIRHLASGKGWTPVAVWQRR
jgi:hypothetical protein